MIGPRTWPANWDALRAGEGCPTCRGGRAGEDPWSVRFFAGEAADACLMRRPVRPGHTVVWFHPRHVADPADLTPDELVTWWREVGVVARALTNLYGACHLNYQIYGNGVPHLHAHVIPRTADDPAPGRPLPDAVLADTQDLTPEQLADQVAALREACRPG